MIGSADGSVDRGCEGPAIRRGDQHRHVVDVQRAIDLSADQCHQLVERPGFPATLSQLVEDRPGVILLTEETPVERGERPGAHPEHDDDGEDGHDEQLQAEPDARFSSVSSRRRYKYTTMPASGSVMTASSEYFARRYCSAERMTSRISTTRSTITE